MTILRMEDMVAKSGLSRYTIMSELKRGALHGVQTKKYGTWRVQDDCFDLWLIGRRCYHAEAAKAA